MYCQFCSLFFYFFCFSIKRERELRILEEKVRIKKLLLDKKQPPKTKLQDGSKDRAPVYIWATERKR